MDTVVYDAIDDLMAQAEYNGKGVETLLNGRVVKSVQRGFASLPSVGNPKDASVNIATVDVNKSIVLVGGGVIEDTSSEALCDVTVKSLTNDTLTFRAKQSSWSNPRSLSVGWQVIEFY